jgi:chemotaxis protein MotB
MARRSKKKNKEPKSSFNMLFLQLMMIMMAFFILLSAISVIIEEKRMKALNSIAGAFNLLPAGANLSQGRGASMPSRELGATNAATKRTAKNLTNVAKLLGVGKAMHVLPLDKSTVRVRLQDQILFEPGKTELNSSIRSLIASIAEIMRQPEIQDITIEGHTDKTPLRGKGAMGNWELSAARAMQIFLELAKHGIPKSKLVAMGMGDTQPLPASETHGNEALNRRVELLIRFRPTTSQEAQLTATDSNTPTSGVSSGGN